MTLLCRRCDQPKSAHTGAALVCPRQLFTFAVLDAPPPPAQSEPDPPSVHLSPGASIGAILGAALGGIVEIAAKESKPRAPCSLCGFTLSHSESCPQHPKVKYEQFRLPPPAETPRKRRIKKNKGKGRRKRT